ncbi:MAG TPA: choice-of-anchor tandem repeat GloVer-containing protein, partial [Bryobacteraceae bacterium]|nr:choice-of-anchor tandem repeat GloVer-containing protein [Bryobacteraceae bacterium]
GVVIGNGGVLYGTTFYGGTGNNGVVFQLVPPASPGGVWTETILHKFAGSPGDGANPHTAVTPGSGGVLYGTTYNGGASGHGTVYQLTPPASPGGAWAETVIHDFAGSPNDGANPHGNLLPGADGVLYGTALSGGEFGQGMVFSLTPPASPGGAWTETVLYSFAGGTDAAEPRAALVMELDGSLYSTTYEGGTSGVGTVFSVSPPASPGGAWTETVWHSFSGADGANPEAGLVMDSNGVLYGATFYGGTSNLGVLFSLDP